MFKRISFFLLALAMACMSVFALAAPEDALLFTDPKDPSVITVMPVGDTLYILARQQNADTRLYEEVLYAYTLGASAAPELVCDDFCYTRHYLTLAQVPAEDSARYADGFGYLFSDGENLYGFNNLTGSMARLTFSQGVMSREEVCTVDLDALRVKGVDYEYLMDLNTTVCANGYITFVFTDWRMDVPASTLYSISLADGSVEKHPLAQPVMYLADAGEDVLLGITYPAADAATGQATPAGIVSIRRSDGAITRLRDWPEDQVPAQVAYHRATDTLYYAAPSIVWAMPALGQPEKVAYTTLAYTDSMRVLDAGYAVLWGLDGVEIRRLDPASLPVHTLTVVNQRRDVEAAKAFAQENPEVPLIYPEGTYGLQELAQETVDVAALWVEDGFDALAAEGYCADLSGSQVLMDFAQSLYPAIREEVMRDGKLLAIPIGFRSNQMFYNAGKLAEIGLTAADMPATLPELCQFITRWNREWMNDPAKANVMPLCTLLPNRQVVLELMLESYRGYYDATGQPLNFDTPLFHELLTALEAMDASSLDQPQQMSDLQYDQFYQLYSGVLLYNGLLYAADVESGNVALPLALNSQTEPQIGISLQVLFVNAHSANSAQALRLLECYVETMDAYTKIPLCPAYNEPLANASYGEYQSQLAQLQARLPEAALEEKPRMEERIAFYQGILADGSVRPWHISPETIARYREAIGPYLYVKHTKPLRDSGSQAFVQIQFLQGRYLQGEITRAQFIHGLNEQLGASAQGGA